MQNGQSTHQFSQFKSQLREQFGSAVYDSYFERLSLAETGEDYVTLCAPTRFSASLISQRYAVRMRQMWSEQIRPVRTLNVKGAQELGIASMEAEAQPVAAAAPVVPQRQKPVVSQEPARPAFDSEGAPTFAQTMTVDRFCTNETNSLAYRAAMKVLEQPTPPVTMIYGPAGRGKTHLLNAIGQEWLRQHPGDNVLYLTYDALMADMW